MKIVIRVFFIFTLFFLFTITIKADSAPPSKKTTFYFQQNEKPVTHPIKFNIKCYGTSFLMDDYHGFYEDSEFLKISELSETCLSYGCEFDTSNIFEVYRKNIKYCDLEGEINGENFKLNKFLKDDLSELKCHRADFTIFTG